jgi:hypothetical protein
MIAIRSPQINRSPCPTVTVPDSCDSANAGARGGEFCPWIMRLIRGRGRTVGCSDGLRGRLQHAVERVALERIAELQIDVEHGVALVTAELLEAVSIFLPGFSQPISVSVKAAAGLSGPRRHATPTRHWNPCCFGHLGAITNSVFPLPARRTGPAVRLPRLESAPVREKPVALDRSPRHQGYGY